jgi:hypothetical protein
MCYLQISVSEPIGLFYTQPSMWDGFTNLCGTPLRGPIVADDGVRDIRQLYRILRYSVIKSSDKDYLVPSFIAVKNSIIVFSK